MTRERMIRMRFDEVSRARRRSPFLTAAAVLAALLGAVPWSGAWAQKEKQAQEQTQPPVTGNGRPGYRGSARNPFDLPPPIVERLSAGDAKAGFQPVEGGFKVPDMKLRGVVLRQDGGKAALLEVQGVGTHVVREGDTIGINAASPNAVIRVKRIERMQVEVEAGSMRQIILVR